MKQTALGMICLLSLTGCITVNGGGRPMGSIVQKNKSKPEKFATQRDAVDDEPSGNLSVRDRTIAQELVAAVPGRH